VGLWYTPDLEEARSMLRACREYLVAAGQGDSQQQFVIVDVETGEEHG